LIVAEGVMSANELAAELSGRAGIETRVSVLGHIQRGGSPSARDRVLASEFGARAVEVLIDGRGGVAIGMQNHQVVDYDLEKVFQTPHRVDLAKYNLSKELSI